MSADTGLSKHEVLYKMKVGVAADTGDSDTGLAQKEILYSIQIGVAADTPDNEDMDDELSGNAL